MTLTSRPGLLLLCHTVPYPPDGGVWIRTYNVIRLLARAFDITALCFERAGPPEMRVNHGGDADLGGLSQFAHVEVFPIPQRHGRLRFFWDHLRSVALRRVYTEFVYESRAFQRRLDQLLSSRAFDIVHADSLGDLVAYLPACNGIPVVCVHHNVESELLGRRASVETSSVRRAYLSYQARLLENVERTWCPRAALNVAVSDADRASLTRIAPNSRFVVVPNGVDLDEFHPSGTIGDGVAGVGGIDWFPNRDALEFFCARILPHLRAIKPHTPIRWIGTALAEQQRTYAERYGIELTGYLSDARASMLEARCHIVPLRAGGGTRLKILNSWAMGKPVISTSVGCEGLAAVDGENIVIADDPLAFADAIVAVLEDDAFASRLAKRGRDTVEQHYSWDLIGQRMIETYFTLVGTPAQNAMVPDVDPV